MSSISSDDVRHIATLCRLTIEESHVDTFAKEMSAILGFIDKLKEVDTKGVEPTPQPTGITNRFREDVICSSQIEPKKLLDCSGLPVMGNLIQTPSAHG